MSVKLGLPDWNKMAVDIIKASKNEAYEGYIDVLEKKLFAPLLVLDALIKEKADIHRYIEQNFIVDKSADLQTHKNLINISGKIVTTNYDNAFEVAKDGIYTVPHNSEYKISNIPSKAEYLFKLHGSANGDASDCIIFTKDYEELYAAGEKAAIFKMRELFINNTILFIGFGFADPYVNKIFERMSAMFDDNHTHYILTTTPDKFSSFDFLRPIELQSYSQIDDFVSLCLPYAEDSSATEIVAVEKVAISSVPKIVILYPKCIDLPELKAAKPLIACFDNIGAEIYKGHLNAKTLQGIDDYDMVFLITSSYKGRLYVEGEDLKSQLMTISDIMLSMPNDKVPTVVISDTMINIDPRFNLACISSYKNEVLNKFLFKVLRNGEKEIINEDINVLGFANTIKYNKAKPIVSSIYGSLNNINFSNKSTEGLVGRTEEQVAIARKIISIIDSRKVLTIKGAGGTGKTTLAKSVSYALYERGYFKDGVMFISCEQVNNFKGFEELIISAFKLNSVLNFKSYLNDNDYKLDLLIILDNFETITSLDNKSDIVEIYKLLEFITDFAHITLTSREVLEEDFEDVFTLASMITDDAVILFEQHYGEVLKEEASILRHEILENLLNNNPLAIKIVTKISIKQKSVLYLKEQLTDSFLESTSLDFESIFNKKADINIERTKSIFQSINYSYCKLSTREKLSFEILHLFPDGIGMSDFKIWFNKEKSSNKISDVDLRALVNKSLVENNDGILQLQPIVRRFAEFQFDKKSEDVKKVYYSDAYSFNAYILKHVDDMYFVSVNRSMKLHNIFKNNLILVLDYIPQINVSKTATVTKQHLLNYVVSLTDYLLTSLQIESFHEKLPSLYEYFDDINNSNELLSVATSVMVYYSQNFDESYSELCEIFKPEEMLTRDMKSEQENELRLKDRASGIHSMEGHTISMVKSFVANDKNKNTYIDSHLFYLGIHVEINELYDDFVTFQRDYVYGTLNVERLENYIKSIFREYHLERMQCTFILSKVKKIPLDRIKKLVVSNPYTKGLQELMMAFNVKDNADKQIHFNKALRNLKHIKYYYLEALYYYCKFLYKTEDARFQARYEEGLSLCQSLYYQYLEFRFRSITSVSIGVYKCDYSYYGIPNLEEFVKVYIVNHNKDNKEYAKKIKGK